MAPSPAWTRKLAKHLVVLAVCLGGTTAISADAMAEALVRIVSPYPATVLDPSRSAAAGNIEVYGQLYSRLLRRDPTSDELQPGLAERWEVSPDGLTVTLFLREAKFSDGSPLTADDVVFSLSRVRSDPKSALPSYLAMVDKVTAKDAKTVELSLQYAMPAILDNLELWNIGIVSKADVEKRGDSAFESAPLASGPYRVREWKPGEKLVLEPNPNYWRQGYPKSDAVVELIEATDPETAVSMLKSGDVDVMREVQWTQVEDINATDGLVASMEPANIIEEILVNHKREPFSNMKARQAAAYALDNKAIAQAVTYGHAKPANTTLPGSLAFHDDSYPGYVQDMDKAKKLMAESGMAGKEVKILVAPDATNQQLGLMIQAQWAAIGLNPVLVNVDTAAWWDLTTKGDYDAAPTWWMNENADPNLAVRWGLCGNCDSFAFFTFYNNDKVNELIEQAARERDTAKRGELYRQISVITTEEVSQIPLYYAPYAIAYSKRLQNLHLTAAMQWTLEEMTVAP